MRLSGAEMVNPTLYEFHNLIVQFSETKVHSLEKDNIDSNRFAVKLKNVKIVTVSLCFPILKF